MPVAAPIKTRFTYDRRYLRYRDNATGRWASARDVKRAVNAVIRKAGEAMRQLADDLAERRITLGVWQERFAAEIKNLHTASAMAGAGGMANMTQRDYGRVGARLRFEYDRLNEFARQLKARKFTYGQLQNRVEMYVAAGNVSYEAARRDGAVDAGYDEERNQLGPNENHCEPDNTRPGCEQLSRLGWVPIGTMTAPGRRACLSRCRCSLKFRRRKRVPA